MEMIVEFPAMNGPYAPESLDEMETRVADYLVVKSAIYVAFSWSEVNAAYEATSRLAAKHKVGFFDASGDKGTVYVPDNFGNIASIVATSSPPL